jgi:hypothetical protein
MTGKAGFCAPATVRPSIWPVACSRTSRRPDNLEVPPHYYTSDTTVLIGEEKKA